MRSKIARNDAPSLAQAITPASVANISRASGNCRLIPSSVKDAFFRPVPPSCRCRRGNCFSSRTKALSASLRDHRYINCHAKILAGRTDKGSGDGNRLTDVPGDGNSYQVNAADRPVCGVIGTLGHKCRPMRASSQPQRRPWIDRPRQNYRDIPSRCVLRSLSCGPPRSAGRRDRGTSPATVECLNGGLCPLSFPALI